MASHPLPGAAPTPREVLVRVHEAAGQFFQGGLASSWVPGYLADRGLDPMVQARWHAGYAPAGWDQLTRHLRRLGYGDDVIQNAGLAYRSGRGTLIDTFRDRAMFPIRDNAGRVIGFIGRAADQATVSVPKYLNSPNTSLYTKGAVLFGLREARCGFANGAQPVIVEGPLDAIAVSIADPARYVGLATCGTALTSQQAARLSGMADLWSTGVLVAFDSDTAGRQAAVRAYQVLAPFTEKLWLSELPAGRDPAEILRRGGPHSLGVILGRRVRPLADLVIDAEIARWERWLAYPEGQINALHATAPIIAALPAAQVGRQVARLAHRLRLDHSLVTDALTDALPGIIAAGPSQPERQRRRM